MNRRNFFGQSLQGLALTSVALAAPAKRRIDRSRISAISDEVAQSEEEAIAFAHHFGLRWLELRDTPGPKGEKKPYFFMPPDELKEHAAAYRKGGIKISFINTNLLKKGLPGTQLAKGNPLPASSQPEFDQRLEHLDECVRAAHAFDCPYLRVFSFLRTDQPAASYDRIANVIGEMAERAHRQGVMLLIENEPSCNVAGCAELAAFLPKVPDRVLGFNWDARNALSAHEVPFPDGYRLLPIGRMRNAQFKGHDFLDTEKPIDWAPIFQALDRDGYQGQIGLETHYFDGTNLERAHAAMAKIVKLADENASAS